MTRQSNVDNDIANFIIEEFSECEKVMERHVISNLSEAEYLY